MDWTAYRLPFFRARMEALEYEIKKIQATTPERLKGHPVVALYIAITDRMKEICANPASDSYLLGNTLGKEHRDWRRAKEGLPDRYRLFFKFFSQNKEIYFAWINDEKSLRKQGAKTDCYAIFKRLLDKGQIPSDRNSLIKQVIEYNKSQQTNASESESLKNKQD